ncbi:DUF5381 family protein [Bacillus sp. B1-b2]|uniref:DUF5381 family protein n=1 Tax=Bacillus sp. B1-b2 TaxID=2653201 RepID=UPI001261C8D1|nr:DUF5381 family protein [Bacillus sp. B1-b2]KAB7671841.1 hypothetical protein F9279_05925 [Bacillus sp. B1-b2]
MPNLKIKNDIISAKGSKFYYLLVLVFFIFGGLIGCLFLLKEGFAFESNYSLFYIFGGIVFTPIFLYLFLWYLPGYKPGKTLFQIDKGTIITPKKTIPAREIKDIYIIRNGFNLMEEIIIETYSGKRSKISTYNIIDDIDIQILVDQYIYPYLTDEAKETWDKNVNLDNLFTTGRYKREEHQIRPE